MITIEDIEKEFLRDLEIHKQNDVLLANLKAAEKQLDDARAALDKFHNENRGYETNLGKVYNNLVDQLKEKHGVSNVE